MKKFCTYKNHITALSNFRKGRRYKGGFVKWCKSCEKEYHAKRYITKKHEILKASQEYYESNKDKVRERHKKWRQANEEIIKKYSKEYDLKFPEKNREKCRRYQAAKLKAVPAWITKEHIVEMQKIYANCPEGYEVDHIVPIQGKNVSGLHVPWNLQHLPLSENRSKRNKY